MNMRFKRLAAMAFFGLSSMAAILLTGCGVVDSGTGPVSNTLTVTGKVMGGQQPVSTSTVQLYAVGTTGYGSSSTPLIASSVVSDSNGSFNITGFYTCPSASTLVYLTATGGNPGISGSANNSAIALVALLGACGNLSASTHVVINEVTTVAAAWALAPFANGPALVGSSATNSTGIANAFSMGANLASSDRGQSPGNAPSGSAVPSAEINTLANILAACVNSAGPSSPACGSLFSNATYNSQVPTDTFTAALDIAKQPGTNVAALYNITTSTGPFQPTLSSAPNDWTVALSFPAGSSVNGGPAIDAGGNVWLVNLTALTQLSPAGAPLGSYPAMAGANVAVDPSGNIWTGYGPYLYNFYLHRLSANLSTTASYLQSGPTNFSGPYNLTGFAFDASGNSWHTCGYCPSVSESNSSGSYVNSFSTGGLHGLNTTVDPSGNIWAGDYDGDKLYKFTSSGANATGSPFPMPISTIGNVTADGVGNVWYAAGSLYMVGPTGVVTSYNGSSGGVGYLNNIAFDGADGLWIMGLSGALSAFTHAGVALSPSTGYRTSYLPSSSTASYRPAIDGSGTVWVPSVTTNAVVAFVGVATPVVTPTALGIKNGTMATRP